MPNVSHRFPNKRRPVKSSPEDNILEAFEKLEDETKIGFLKLAKRGAEAVEKASVAISPGEQIARSLVTMWWKG